ncbi:MAG: nuclear transport factor 2 family protein [Negativibacillus massiliensis]|uniref:nuclear transport factor 2 family protein n=1 Tax=Negativibacillus massiliensis TaxID=1871035 RepID=UPI0039A1EEAE
MEITAYFQDVVKQDAQKLKNYFAKDAKVLWHNTNECFTAEEFIRANCEYPGSWDGEIEILTSMQDGWILAARVWEKDLAQNGEEVSFHVVSFVHMQGEKISRIDEYWGDDGKAPQWRLDKKIGTPIR